MIITKVDKKFIPAQIGGVLAYVLNPFIKLYLSACIIDELMGNRNGRILITYIVVLLISNLVLSTIGMLVVHYRDC